MEPERPVEKALRAYAEQRRRKAGPPMELHPATRRLLQGEIARRYGKAPGTQPPTRLAWLATLWPRAAWALAIVAVVALLAVVILPSSSRSKGKIAPAQLALRTPAERPAEPQAAAPVPITLADGAPAMKDALAKSAEPPMKRERELATTESDRSAAGAPLVLADAEKKVQTANAISAEAAKAPVIAPAPPGETLAFAPPATSSFKRQTPAADAPAARSLDTVSGLSAAKSALSPPAAKELPAQSFADAQNRRAGETGLVGQRYRQIPVASGAEALMDKSATKSAVLASFQVEQRGDEVRVLDSDGSVYLGRAETAESKARFGLIAGGVRNAPAARQDQTSAAPGEQLGGQSYAFRVSGTNRTLNVRVVFTGYLVAATNSASGSLTSRAQPAGAGAAASPGPQISGKAAIGDKPEIEIFALPEGR